MLNIKQCQTADNSKNGKWFKISHPYNPEAFAEFKIVGRKNETVRTLAKKAEALTTSRLQKQERGADVSKLESQLEELAKKIAVEVVVDWRGVLDEGKELPCSTENKEMLFHSADWLCERIGTIMRSDENFLDDGEGEQDFLDDQKGSTKQSKNT